MAPHHHHHITTSCSACSCSHCFQPPLASPHPQPQQSDPLLQALASLLLQSQSQPQPQPQPHQNHYLNQTHCLKSFQDQNPAIKSHHFYQRQQHHQEEPNFLLSSLVSRINALELSLQHFSTVSNPCAYPSFSLRDAAARIIQTHFRAFLVHRSRTLRQLKDLACIKSSLDSLKLAVSNRTYFDYAAVSQKAMDLHLKLKSFQGGDPMIRDGKRSVSIDLLQFLEYIHGLALKRNKHLSMNAKNVRVWGNGSKARILRSNSGETMEKLRDRIENLERISINEEGVVDDDDDDVELEGFHQVIGERLNPRISIAGKAVTSATQNRNGEVLVKRQGIQPRVKKNVSFAENGNVYRIISSENELGSSGDGSLTDDNVSSDEHGEIMEDIVIKENGGLVENEKEVNLNNEESTYDYQIQDGDFLFSAPLPVKMESKADLMKNRKGSLHIVS